MPTRPPQSPLVPSPHASPPIRSAQVAMSEIEWIEVTDPNSSAKAWLNFAKKQVKWDKKPTDETKQSQSETLNKANPAKLWKPLPSDDSLPKALCKGLCYFDDSTYFGRLSFEGKPYSAIFKKDGYYCSLILSSDVSFPKALPKAENIMKEWAYETETLRVSKGNPGDHSFTAVFKESGMKEDTTVILSAPSADEANAWAALLRQCSKECHYVWANSRLTEIRQDTRDPSILRCLWHSLWMPQFTVKQQTLGGATKRQHFMCRRKKGSQHFKARLK